MEGKKHFVTLLVFCFIGFQSHASNKIKIYEAYISNNMDVWQKVIDEMEKTENKQIDFLLELINYQYGYIGYCLSIENKTLAKKYLDLAENNLEKMENQKGPPSMIHSYKSAFYGFKIGLSPYKAPVLGPKSMKHAQLAMELNPENAMGYVQYGNVQFYMPEVFGGSKTEAIENFLKAVEIAEKNHEFTNDWNYLSWLVLIGQSFQKLENNEMAEKYFKKCLAVEPGFVWVKNELLPEIKMNKKNE